MKKKITELTVKIPLVTEEDLLHNELNMYLLYLEAGIFISNLNSATKCIVCC